MNIALLIVGIINIILLVVLIGLTVGSTEAYNDSKETAETYYQVYHEVSKELQNLKNEIYDLSLQFNKILEDSNIEIDQYGSIRYKGLDPIDDSDYSGYTRRGGQ